MISGFIAGDGLVDEDSAGIDHVGRGIGIRGAGAIAIAGFALAVTTLTAMRNSPPPLDGKKIALFFLGTQRFPVGASWGREEVTA